MSARIPFTLSGRPKRPWRWSGPNVEIDKDGNVTKRVNRVAQTLKWLFLTLVAVIALIILIRIKLRR